MSNFPPQQFSSVQYSRGGGGFPLSLSSWQFWTIAGSLLALLATVGLTIVFLSEAPNESGLLRVGYAVIVPLLILVLPGLLILIGLLVPSAVARSRLVTTGAIVLAAFTALCVPLQGQAVLGHNAKASRVRYQLAKDEAKQVVEEVVGNTNNLGKELLKSGGLNPRTMTSE